MPKIPDPIHVPTEDEVNTLYKRQQKAVERWQHALSVADDTPDTPGALPDEPLSHQEQLEILRWLSANDIIRHRKAAVLWLSRQYLRASRIRMMFLTGELN